MAKQRNFDWATIKQSAEIILQRRGLAEEYAHILVSYARKDANYLEHEVLQRGLLWGIGGLAEGRPLLLSDAGRHLVPYLKSSDAAARGLAARAAGILGIASARTSLLELAGDQTPVVTYTQGKVGHLRVADLAKEALERLDRHDR